MSSERHADKPSPQLSSNCPLTSPTSTEASNLLKCITMTPRTSSNLDSVYENLLSANRRTPSFRYSLRKQHSRLVNALPTPRLSAGPDFMGTASTGNSDPKEASDAREKGDPLGTKLSKDLAMLEVTATTSPLHQPHPQTPSKSSRKRKRTEELPNCPPFLFNHPSLIRKYRILGKLGKGTFSTVYKAVDCFHSLYENEAWTAALGNDGLDQYKDSVGHPSRMVALKKITQTSGAQRLLNEIITLRKLRGHRNVVSLITAHRHLDQVIMVFPVYQSIDFRDYFQSFNLEEIKFYMRNLFEGLKFVHDRRIIHRDIKPSNFMYDPIRRRGVIVDFGLAEEMPENMPRPNASHSLPARPFLPVTTPDTVSHPDPRFRRFQGGISQDMSIRKGSKRIIEHRFGKPCKIRGDRRPPVTANRAGTRGIRAPEVLFRYPHQTCAVDVWAAGTILLSFMTARFPVFQAAEDHDSLMEFATVFGRRELKEVAASLDRTFDVAGPEVVEERISWRTLVKRLRPSSSPCPGDRTTIEFLDLTLKLFVCDRITAEEALDHPFLKGTRLRVTGPGVRGGRVSRASVAAGEKCP